MYCTDRHTITITTVEAPDIPAALCGKCEEGFTLMPMSNLGYKMLGICYSIKGINQAGGQGCDESVPSNAAPGTDEFKSSCRVPPLPLWNRVKTLPRNTYNDRSCRYFMTIKGWKKKKNYIEEKKGIGKGIWLRTTQLSDHKRAHGTHCAVTTYASDASLGEYKDPHAAEEVAKRKHSNPKGKLWCESCSRAPGNGHKMVDLEMSSSSKFFQGNSSHEAVLAEGWKYDFQELKVAKYSGCYTKLESKPVLTCDKATEILECQQVRVFSTKAWLNAKVENDGYSIVNTSAHKHDHTIYSTERASWWNKGSQALSMYVVDEAPFSCPSDVPRLCRRHWENRAEYLARKALASNEVSSAYKGCQRMVSEAALSLQ